MIKYITLFLLLPVCASLYAQKRNVDSMIQKIAREKEDDKKMQLIVDFYTPEINNEPAYAIDLGLKLLKQSQADKNIIETSSAYSCLGQGYRLLGNNISALEYHHKAIALAENSGNFSLLAIAKNQVANIYKDRGEYHKAIQLYQSSSADAEKGKSEEVCVWPLANLGSVYLAANKLDSALMYVQRAYEKNLKRKDRNVEQLAFLNLGGIHSKMGNGPLAVTYYNMGIQACTGIANTRYLNMIYTGLAGHYQRVQQTDSAEFYARKAIAIVNNTSFYYLSSRSAQLLADIYGKTNCDSTLKYLNVFKSANDSLSNSKANQQILLMTFDEDLRQQELAAEKIKAREERQQNIQYALIALSIVVLLSLYLLLSRSFITNAKWIEFFGVIALLIVFEFLNLLLHPFLERITHHSPVLMLLALVCIAALLVPLHHKVEKWATHKLVEKNKKIRLSMAKRTIAQLEKDE